MATPRPFHSSQLERDITSAVDSVSVPQIVLALSLMLVLVLVLESGVDRHTSPSSSLPSNMPS